MTTGQITVRVGGEITVRCGRSPSTPPPGPVPAAGLPVRVAGIYHPTWDPTPLEDTPAAVNTVFLAFAVPDLDGPPGAVTPPVPDWSALREEVAVLRARGTAVALSIGGAGVHVPVTTPDERAAFTASVEALHDLVGPFDAVDLDLEHPIDVPTLAGAALDLHFRLGVDLCATSSGNNLEYKELARQVTDGGYPMVLGIQYYDYPAPAAQHVIDRTAQLVDGYGLDPTQVLIGVRHVGDPAATWTAGEIVDMWGQVAGLWPTIRGVTSWGSILDRETPHAPGVPGFAGVVAPLVITTS